MNYHPLSQKARRPGPFLEPPEQHPITHGQAGRAARSIQTKLFVAVVRALGSPVNTTFPSIRPWFSGNNAGRFLGSISGISGSTKADTLSPMARPSQEKITSAVEVLS